MKWKRGPAILIIILCLLAFSWFILDQLGISNPLSDLVSTIIAPLQYSANAISPTPGEISGAFVSEESLREQLRAAEDEIAQLRAQIILLQEAELENESLREQLDYKNTSPSYTLLSAEVIGKDPVGELDYLIIDRGSQDGLQVGMPVVAPEGLIGRVSQVAQASSRIMLITDPSSSVTGIVQSSRSSGLVEGETGHYLVMRYIPQEDTITEGDVVLTSGLGSVFPKGLVIGQIIEVSRQDIDMFQTATLVPSVNLFDLESVMVITNFDSTMLDELEEE